jgi:urease accessory protein UreF
VLKSGLGVLAEVPRRRRHELRNMGVNFIAIFVQLGGRETSLWWRGGRVQGLSVGFRV